MNSGSLTPASPALPPSHAGASGRAPSTSPTGCAFLTPYKGGEKSRKNLGLFKDFVVRPGRVPGGAPEGPRRTGLRQRHPPQERPSGPLGAAPHSRAAGDAPEFRRFARSSAPVHCRLYERTSPAPEKGRARTLRQGRGGRPPGQETRRSGRAGTRRPERRLRDSGDRRGQRETPGLIRTRTRHAPSRWPGCVSSFADLGAGTSKDSNLKRDSRAALSRCLRPAPPGGRFRPYLPGGPEIT